MLESKYKHCVSLHVDGPPPWKPSPGPQRKKYEPARKALVDRLQREAYRVKAEEIFFSERVALAIKYKRLEGARDAANIIGGIADSLQKILYRNDSALVEVHYQEETGSRDEYEVEVAKVV